MIHEKYNHAALARPIEHVAGHGSHALQQSSLNMRLSCSGAAVEPFFHGAVNCCNGQRGYKLGHYRALEGGEQKLPHMTCADAFIPGQAGAVLYDQLGKMELF